MHNHRNGLCRFIDTGISSKNFWSGGSFVERVGDCHGGLKIVGRWFGFLEFHFRQNYEKYIVSGNIYFDKKNKKHMKKDTLCVDPRSVWNLSGSKVEST